MHLSSGCRTCMVIRLVALPGLQSVLPIGIETLFRLTLIQPANNELDQSKCNQSVARVSLKIKKLCKKYVINYYWMILFSGGAYIVMAYKFIVKL